MRKETVNEKTNQDIEWLFKSEKNAKNQPFLRKLLWKDKWLIFATTLIYILQALPLWLLPLITGDVIDAITYQPDGFVNRIIIDAIILAVLIPFNVPMCMWRSSIIHRWCRNTTAKIKSGTIRKLQRLSITYHREIEEGRIQSKFLRDIENVEMYYRSFVVIIIPHSVSMVVSLAIALTKSPLVMIFFLIAIPLNILLTVAFRTRIRNQYRGLRHKNEDLSAKITTSLQMITLTKAHGLLDTETEQIDEHIGLVKDAGVKVDQTGAMFGAMLWASMQLLSAICLFFCVFLAIQGIISPGEVVLFQSLFTSVVGSVSSLVNQYPMFASGKEAVHSLGELISSEDIEHDGGTVTLKNLDGAVSIENAYYRYPGVDEYALKNISLSVKPGECIAVVGASGSGKSTLMNLIIGLLSTDKGSVKIDGTPLDELSKKEFRRFLSVVPQNSILFSGTIRENITYGLEHYTEADLQTALDRANVTEFLPSLPKGVDTIVGEHGDKLSGGEKQRVCIARALIRDPKILIMDEATSSLDNVSEYQVQKAIENMSQSRTTFIVAHRLSTIRNADRIVVMDNGEIVELGSYEELMALNGKFTELERLSRMRENQIKNG
ncbi:MAG: ABC transporter ATP-binding protein [Clostridia bacterium]|nr:ABC transporter ATP-binding protein [Clostridia bacterium]